MQCNGKHIVVTGATGGIGQELLPLLLAEGAKVTTIGRTNGHLPAGVTFLKGDLASVNDIGAIADTLKQQQVDILIHLAGMQFFGPLETQTPEHVTATCHLGLVAPILLTQAVLPQMKQRNSGHIVQVGSIFGSIPFAYFATYSSVKAGLKAFSEALRREVRDSGIDVTYIAPRAVDTAMNNAQIRRFGMITKMKMDHPEWVARQIVQSIKTGKKDVYLGFPEKLFVRINAILPRLVDKALRKNNKLAGKLFN